MSHYSDLLDSAETWPRDHVLRMKFAVALGARDTRHMIHLWAYALGEYYGLDRPGHYAFMVISHYTKRGHR